MRRAFNDGGFCYAEDGSLWAVALGFDFAAEHECGVRSIHDAFGVGRAATKGIEKRRMTIVPEGLSFYRARDGGEALLSYLTSGGEVRKASTLRNHSELKFYDSFLRIRKEEPRDNFVAAWDGSYFALHVRGTENVAALKTLHEAFKRCEIMFGMSPVKGWLGSGLVFALASSFDDETRAEVLAVDESHERLLSAVELSGIKDTLEKAGRSYFACKPKWTDADESGIRFWLNPMQQQENNYGWFSLADLAAWAKGEGPIPKVSGN